MENLQQRTDPRLDIVDSLVRSQIDHLAELKDDNIGAVSNTEFVLAQFSMAIVYLIYNSKESEQIKKAMFGNKDHVKLSIDACAYAVRLLRDHAKSMTRSN
jgi:hypothetical protein